MTPSAIPSRARVHFFGSRSLVGTFLGVCSLVSGLAWSFTAEAQTINLANYYDRRSGRPTGLSKTLINRDDCRAEDTLVVTANVANITALATPKIDVWASASGDCNDTLSRSNGTCWYVTTAAAVTGQIPIPVQSIIKKKDGATDLCTSSDQDSVSLFFLLMDGSTSKTSAKLSVTYDLIGPSPPKGVTIGVGENRLYPRWTASTSTERIKGYNVYCDLNYGTGTGNEDGTGGSTPNTDGEDMSGGGTTSTTDDSSSCFSPNIKPGELPDPDYFRGFSDPVTGRGEARGLENNREYACAVATLDFNENVGVLSEVACGSPQPVDGYYDLYRAAGGQAGGGICSFGRRPLDAASGVLGLVTVGLLIARRRRASQRGSQ